MKGKIIQVVGHEQEYMVMDTIMIDGQTHYLVVQDNDTGTSLTVPAVLVNQIKEIEKKSFPEKIMPYAKALYMVLPEVIQRLEEMIGRSTATDYDYKEEKDEWRLDNEEIGKKLGYPQCCIDEFCDQPPEYLRKHDPTFTDSLRYQASKIDDKFTGFIPCVKHAKMILEEEIKLEELIEFRDPSYPPFPYYGNYEE